MQTTDPSGLPVIDAGVPWFSTLFGRDALITAYQSLLVNPDLAKGTLAKLAQRERQRRGNLRRAGGRFAGSSSLAEASAASASHTGLVLRFGGFTLGQLEVAVVLLVDAIRVSRIRRRSADARHTPSRPNASHG